MFLSFVTIVSDCEVMKIFNPKDLRICSGDGVAMLAIFLLSLLPYSLTIRKFEYLIFTKEKKHGYSKFGINIILMPY